MKTVIARMSSQASADALTALVKSTAATVAVGGNYEVQVDIRTLEQAKAERAAAIQQAASAALAAMEADYDTLYGRKQAALAAIAAAATNDAVDAVAF